jgi:hypothetical protein
VSAEGSPGLPGEPGEEGGRGGRGGQGGSASRSRPVHNAVRILIFLTAGLYLALGIVIVGFAIHADHQRDEIKSLVVENAKKDGQFKELANARRADRLRVDYSLCVKINTIADVVADTLKGILKESGGDGVGDSARKEGLVRLAPIACPPKPMQPR